MRKVIGEIVYQIIDILVEVVYQIIDKTMRLLAFFGGLIQFISFCFCLLLATAIVGEIIAAPLKTEKVEIQARNYEIVEKHITINDYCLKYVVFVKDVETDKHYGIVNFKADDYAAIETNDIKELRLEKDSHNSKNQKWYVVQELKAEAEPKGVVE